MRSLAIVLMTCLGLPAALWAQAQPDDQDIPRLESMLNRMQGRGSLHCRVNTWRPVLNFGFRFQSGYIANFPFKDFAGKNPGIGVLMRITPEDHSQQPVYLIQTWKLPRVPDKTKAQGEFSGGFLLGEGKYTVEWLLVDREDHYCRQRWRVEAKVPQKKLQSALPPGIVMPLVLTPNKALDQLGDCPSPLSLTVLLHASPVFWRSPKLRAFDRGLLMGSLVALVEQTECTTLRVVAFNLDQRTEIFRQERLTRDGLKELSQSLADLELGTVSLRQLQQQDGDLSTLSKLIEEEQSANPRTDAVVILGPMVRDQGNPAPDVAERWTKDRPYFYLQLKPFFRPGFDYPDTISRAVKALDGRTYAVYNPTEFANAIRDLEKRTRNARQSATSDAKAPEPSIPH